MSHPIGTPNRPLRVAIIGAGPSGFYAAGALLDQAEVAVTVDLVDRLPTPYGLVRDGVAPDHAKIKTVTRVYHKTASDPRVRFWGNIRFGEHLTHADARRFYDAIVYAVGAPSDRQMGIPGEALLGSDPATIFVGWYNAHPDYTDLDFDLQGDVAVVGNGNVAMDVARIVAKPADTLAATDIADHALARLRASTVETVYVLGRRGPAQAAFTNPELRELGELPDVDVIVDPADLELDPASAAAVEQDREAARNLATLRTFAARGSTGAPRRIVMRFLVSPVEVLGVDGAVAGLRLERNRLEATERGDLRAVGTGQFETLPVRRVFRAIGYRGVPLPGVPFDERRAVIPNREGCVLDPASGDPIPREYVVGWAKRGPSGIIGTNKADAVETVRHLLADVPHLPPAPEPDPASLERHLRDRQPALVPFTDWLLLDAAETMRGQPAGRPRVKFARVADMLEAIAAAKREV